MIVRRALLVALALTVSCGKSKSSENAPGDASPPTPTVSDASAADLAVAYPDEAAGLKRLIEDVVRTASIRDQGDEAPLYRLTQSLRLRAPAEWFDGHFDEPLSKNLERDYKVIYDNIGSLVDTVLELRKKDNLVNINVEVYRTANNDRVVRYQEHALRQMKKGALTKLYSVRLTNTKGDKIFHLWSFVYHESSFRFVGKMKAVRPGAPQIKGRDKFEYTFEDGNKLSAAP